MDSVTDTVSEIVEELRSRGNPASIAGMARYGINVGHAFGNSMPSIRELARIVGKQHEVALALWETGIHDARLLCAFCDDARDVSAIQMDAWAMDFNSWDLTDQVCNNLFSHTDHAQKKIILWAAREEEFIRRAAFALIASLAVHGKKLPDEQFLSWFPLVEATASDGRNFVKKAVNWALRQIGKRNVHLHEEAILLAEKLAERTDSSSRWIAQDALRELHRPDIIARVRKKSGL